MTKPQLDSLGRRQLIADGVPSLNGLLASSCHPREATTAFAIPAAGVLLVVRMVMQVTAPIETVSVYMSAGGSSLTAGQCFAGLYDASGNQLGVSADQATAWATSGQKDMALTSATAVQAAGQPVYGAFVWNGTTGPQMRGPAGGGFPNWGVSGSMLRCATILTAQTSLPGSITLSSLAAFGGSVPLVALS